MKNQIESECDPDTARLLQGQWDVHKRKAERAYHLLREDTAQSQADPNLDVITFDLQASLPTPLLTVNVIYYKRQLWTYNLGIHCCATGAGHMHMWNESQASRGSQEVGSCLLTYLKEHSTTATHLTAYTDSCGGQNRNINIVCLLLHIVCSADYSYTIIDHKFMISGHSYLPNDRDFGGIERLRRRTTSLFVPEEWCTLVEGACRVNPFRVRRMQREDFISTTPLTEMIVNRKKNVNNEKVEWLNIHWIRVEKACPLSFKYRYTHNDLEPWKLVDLGPKRVGRPVDMGRVTLAPLYDSARPINPAKLRDLKSLLCYIPPIYYSFYDALQSADEDQD